MIQAFIFDSKFVEIVVDPDLPGQPSLCVRGAAMLQFQFHFRLLV